MSIFNRLVVVVIALLILAGAVITLLVSFGVIIPDILILFEPQLRAVADATGSIAVGIVAVSVLIVLGMIAILVLEAMPTRKPPRVLISSSEEGIVTIDIKSICMLAEKTAAVIHSVRNVKCYTKKAAGGLVISCQSLVILGTNLPEVGTELQSKIKEAIEQFTGLTVASIDVSAKYESVEARQLAVR